MYSLGILCGLLFATASAGTSCDSLPIVDLGYEIYQATAFNETGQYYNFSNIRYARAPTGELRFAPPQPPLKNRTAVQRGDRAISCPQAYAIWYRCGLEMLSHQINDPSQCNSSILPPAEPSEQEDCLFLDVMVPKSVFRNKNTRKAPVIVWIYGGGFAFGKKGGDGNAAGLIQRSRSVDSTGQGVIYIQFNYRGGAFGFLPGAVEENGAANAGLRDQRLLLEWVQNNIHLFGGDSKQVTVFGQSAGGGSIMHQLTAYGGLKPSLFRRAILQSPGFPLIPSRYQQNELLQNYLARLNVSSVAEARRVPFEVLQQANLDIVAQSDQGTFTWAPVPDGSFVPSLPGALLSQGAYDKSVQIMTGFNAHETLEFVSQANVNNSVYLQSLETTFPTAPRSVINYISDTLYPPLFNGTLPYDDFFTRAQLSLAEAAFTCNTRYLQTAVREHFATYGYRFSIPPAYHGQDVPYTFFNGPNDQFVSNETIANAMQSYILSFAITGDPNRNALVKMPIYGERNQILDLNVTGIQQITDPNNNERCRWWQKALFY
ncbi:uncharacterized protein TRIVIDRAFT_151632 [Trichoderma virens Gv29-8]|uniref:Carboxylic ester hydrolase n=1 Tax=Hypocrea virens (strain Gv29-8 / FGSC 10586) TaxID=413071 RepID=G9MUK0_HYPVG|nr:uncharacterized protein TRIVIDRAFT_151632 [Trichoderma virens Gv29-8]EHK21879.1 hypothetical protein TRIVIDRAFT_151632 [Trichoderma virens Gv29-8]UKZ54399.1 hypothetical protein TrVGV298_008207 [Trichoderma virens]